MQHLKFKLRRGDGNCDQRTESLMPTLAVFIKYSFQILETFGFSFGVSVSPIFPARLSLRLVGWFPRSCATLRHCVSDSLLKEDAGRSRGGRLLGRPRPLMPRLAIPSEIPRAPLWCHILLHYPRARRVLAPPLLWFGRDIVL